MVQKKPREKTADELQTERITAALEETDRPGRAPAFVRENPGQFLRDMYEVWHRQGGKVGGRPRNSIRKMRDEWLVGRNAVPSLHPKLMGRVKMTRADARALVDLFLGRWRYGEGEHVPSSMAKDGYVAFASADQRRLREQLVYALFGSSRADAPKSLNLPEHEPDYRFHGSDLRIQTFIEEEYRQCDALITFSRNRIAVGPTPAETMKAFLQLFHELYNEDKKTPQKERAFIWVVDFGQRLIEADESFSEYYNMGFLALLFQAFAKFESENDDKAHHHGRIFRQLKIQDAGERARRWEWLSQRAVIIAENLRIEEADGLYPFDENEILRIRLRDSPVTQQHILPREVPPNWTKDLHSLVGKKVDMGNISTTVLLRKDGWIEDGIGASDLKYYAHARIIKNPDSNFATATVESVKLSPVGQIYNDAFRIIYSASICRMKQEFDFESDEAIAFAYLRKLGFHVLTLSDYIKIQSLGLA